MRGWGGLVADGELMGVEGMGSRWGADGMGSRWDGPCYLHV